MEIIHLRVQRFPWISIHVPVNWCRHDFVEMKPISWFRLWHWESSKLTFTCFDMNIVGSQIKGGQSCVKNIPTDVSIIECRAYWCQQNYNPCKYMCIYCMYTHTYTDRYCIQCAHLYVWIQIHVYTYKGIILRTRVSYWEVEFGMSKLSQKTLVGNKEFQEKPFTMTHLLIHWYFYIFGLGFEKCTIVAKITPFLRWEGQVPKALSNPIPN